MSGWSRRHLLRSASAISTLPWLFANKRAIVEATEPNLTAGDIRVWPDVSGISEPAVKGPRPFVHTTDLFRPYNDPDDHWDLATAFALAWRGELDLQAILADNPQNLEEMPDRLKITEDYVDNHMHVPRSPDVAAVAQLNYITDKGVPVTTGSIWPGKPGEKVREDNLPKELRGVNMLLHILRRSSQPVAILTGGSCQDVAIAGKKEPRLFLEKCAAIYMNAGRGSQNPKEQSIEGDVEWNVGLNRGGYATMFELPCPIYWMPCYYGLTANYELIAGEYGTNWSFRQKEVLPYVSKRLQAFFAYVLSKESGTNWLSYLLDPSSTNAAQKYLNDERGMSSTAGFLHAAGKTVTSDGNIVSLQTAPDNAAYEFMPIEVTCDETGITEWQKTGKPTDRFIFCVKNRDNYAKAMVKALRSMLLELP